MTGLLFTGGEGPSRAQLAPFLAGTELVIAADSGLELARALGIEPALVVGDMDSLRDQGLLTAYGERVIRFAADKDETDTEIGLRLLRERAVARVILAGGGGGRLAHLLGLLALFERPFSPAVWLTAREHIQVVAERFSLTGCLGQTISFFPLGGSALIARSRGLKWPLDRLAWGRGDVGISNVAVGEPVEVDVSRGRLLMVREW